ncbi:polymer-forming cytoskeletal protein [Haloferax marisrubri]|uniref:polymer-forming cytoskeletal protein n=1 Tax=Haloferax marisrubri TaxID=1544719 RepID=UPI000AA2573A|nr:polymer-forming cytoskeletal protein [Haloferax marisrubri]
MTSRRSVLLGLGSMLTAGGALVGSGAFTTVSAQRAVSVDTAGDASAFLTLTGDGVYVSDDSATGTLTIDLGGPSAAGFNQNAVTTVTDIVTIANNAADGSPTYVGVSTDAPSADPTADPSATIALEAGTVTFAVGSVASPSVQSLSSGESTALHATIDTTAGGNGSPTGQLTIVATNEAPSGDGAGESGGSDGSGGSGDVSGSNGSGDAGGSNDSTPPSPPSDAIRVSADSNTPIDADGAVVIESGVTLSSNVNNARSLFLLSGATITGDVNVSGDIVLRSGARLNGNVNGGQNLYLRSGSRVSGNVSVSGQIYLKQANQIEGHVNTGTVSFAY